ncbi:MAG: glycoside hydrolase family 9 protein [Deltaproteobacteria bacterium]|nr:glycoside hydrolase family 9 protein [Deltaproteobacteria bacterium]
MLRKLMMFFTAILLIAGGGCSESDNGRMGESGNGTDIGSDADADGDGDTDQTGTDSSAAADADSDGDSDSDSDTDGDGDLDSDSDSDGDSHGDKDGDVTYPEWPFGDFADGDGDGLSDGFWGEDGVWYQNPEFCVPPPFPNEATCKGKQGVWAHALQMALWFFNINKSGRGVYCTDVQWRGPAHISDSHFKLDPDDPNGVNLPAEYIEKYRNVLDPDGNGEVDLSGGYYDAGDFIKFALTTGFMAQTLAWAVYEFPEAFYNTGLDGEALDQITWAADWIMRSTFIEDKTLPAKDWKVVAYAHQNGTVSDHACGWMPPELRTPERCPRKAYFVYEGQEGADVSASAAAALALTYLVTKDQRPDYAIRALNNAIALYNFAATVPDVCARDDGGLYNSEYAWDDLGWAAAWLYEATKDEKYFDEAIEWTYHYPGFSKTCVDELIQWESYSESNACWYESWTHVWNSVRSGVFVRLAVSMSEAGDDGKYAKYGKLFQYIARMDSMGWVEGAHTDQGFAKKFDVSWGSARYNAAGQMVAMIYAKHFPEDSASDQIKEWATRQSMYLLGDNEVNGDPEGKCFMMGFTDISPNYPLQPHHAAGHASIYGEPGNPTENRHILWGALVNGPTKGDDVHIDDREDYSANEVTIDYNASWVGALAGNYVNNGAEGCPDPSFPPVEERIDEFYTMGRKNGSGETGCRSQVEITMMNESIHPPRFNEYLESRYYIDVSEIIAAGDDPAQMTAMIANDNSDQNPTVLEGPFPCEKNGNMWYFKLDYSGQKFWGANSWLNGPRYTLVDFGMPSAGSCNWDVTNDWSYEGLTEEVVKTPHITAYGKDDRLLWGEEPECHEVRSVIYVE